MKTYTQLAEELLQNAKTYTPADETRRAALVALADYIKDKIKAQKAIRLNFICTHNSRRSHLGAVLSQVLAAYFKLENFESFSGGTEATAFNENAVQALRELGVEINKIEEGSNPRYEVVTGDLKSVAFSKKFDEAPNPTSEFAAIMVCDSADANCPFVPEAEKRISLPFEDPKKSDGTGREALVYRERALEIGTQLAWVFLNLSVS
ncbi:MAG: hypothetical protein KDK38_04600 [Leptospiraceae bacterium]|nr:hypothetical protein [Leptospiraceae bacterium]